MAGTAQDHGIPNKTVERFRSIQARLAPDSGCTANERAIAAKQIDRMRAKHPGIDVVARLHDYDLPDDVGSFFDSGQESSFFGDLFGSIRNAVNEVAIAENIRIQVTNHAVASTDHTATQIKATVALPESIYRELRQHGPTVRRQVAEAMAAKLLIEIERTLP